MELERRHQEPETAYGPIRTKVDHVSNIRIENTPSPLSQESPITLTDGGTQRPAPITVMFGEEYLIGH
jgi:hypothetical protein